MINGQTDTYAYGKIRKQPTCREKSEGDYTESSKDEKGLHGPIHSTTTY